MGTLDRIETFGTFRIYFGRTLTVSRAHRKFLLVSNYLLNHQFISAFISMKILLRFTETKKGSSFGLKKKKNMKENENGGEEVTTTKSNNNVDDKKVQ